MPIREPKGANDKDIVKCVAVRCASGLMKSKRGWTKPTLCSYRPQSTATILASQVVEAEEVIDMEPAMSRRVVGMS